MMLSVTIILSFSLLLGYLMFVDSSLFNDYKVLLSCDPNVVLAYSYDQNGYAHNSLSESIDDIDSSASHYMYYTSNTKLMQYDYNISAQLVFIPMGDVPVYQYYLYSTDKDIYQVAKEVELIKGKDAFYLLENEAVVNESFYKTISPQGELPVEIDVPVTWSDESVTWVRLNIVGVCKDDSRNNIPQGAENTMMVTIYLSQEQIGDKNASDLFSLTRLTWAYSEKAEEIDASAKQLGMISHCIKDQQLEAMVVIKAQKATKGIVAIILMVLLGINLYSSFSNALNDRKFEIGVKRAIGASSWDIIRQFLYEGLVVMITNIVLSILVVTNIAIAYKAYQYIVEDVQWVIDISIYSVIIFGVCSIFLTIVFSLLFAYKSTRIEIVKYLKAE